jgi:hypothetical protein
MQSPSPQTKHAGEMNGGGVMGRQIGPWLGEPRAAILEARVRPLEMRLEALEERIRQLEAKLAALNDARLTGTGLNAKESEDEAYDR